VAGGRTFDERFGHFPGLAAAGARMGVLDPGSVNLGSHGPDGLPGAGSFVYQTSYADIAGLVDLLAETRQGPSIAIYEPGFLRTTLAYAKAGKLPAGAMVKFYFAGPYNFLDGQKSDVTFGLPPTEKALEAYLEMMAGLVPAVDRRRHRRLGRRHGNGRAWPSSAAAMSASGWRTTAARTGQPTRTSSPRSPRSPRPAAAPWRRRRKPPASWACRHRPSDGQQRASVRTSCNLREALMIPLRVSIEAYEADLRAAFGETLRTADLELKHERMAESAFLFLRATAWRWAEAAGELCPELMGAPAVGCVGDAHAGNFGLWRDAEARLVWGVNDFDEAAMTPYGLDLVRLCASVLLAGGHTEAKAVAREVLRGYLGGLETPRPFVLERDHVWLRDAFQASDDERDDFWRELKDAPDDGDVPASYRAALMAALPAGGPARVFPRSAGAGSLGRPRFVAYGRVQGGPLAREIKGRMASCWREGRDPGLPERLATGPWRSPDPFLAFAEGHVLRRLAPNSRKLRFEKVRRKLGDRLFAAMGADLAAVHAATPGAPDAIAADLSGRRGPWLAAAAQTVARWTETEFRAYRR
jgi:hypothetical protein